MSIKRYFANADNTITNAFMDDLRTRGTGANMGQADILEVFSVYAQASTSSVEKSRALIKFPVSTFSTDRTAGTIPASGSVSWYLKLYNAEHGRTLPTNVAYLVSSISRDWTEGTGLDMEGYSDLGKSNWDSASAAVSWTTAGGDFSTSGTYTFSASAGDENINIDVTSLVEAWMGGVRDNHGFIVKLIDTFENGTRSYYTKKFFGRGTEFFFKRPVLEARWDSSEKDQRNNFFYSSSLASAAENLNTIYLYNYVRGRLRDIPAIGTGAIYVSLYSGSTGPTGSALALTADGAHVASTTPRRATGSHVSTGIYKATMALTAASTPLTKLFDVWQNKAGTDDYKTGSIEPKTLASLDSYPDDEYVSAISNMKSSYRYNEIPVFRVHIRKKDWSPTIYTVASKQVINSETIESASYSIHRVVDDLEVVPYGTGSDMETRMSFDVSGNYFSLDMEMLEPGYMYGMTFSYYNDALASWLEQPETFKFRIDKKQSK
jgi:hypothetical protein